MVALLALVNQVSVANARFDFASSSDSFRSPILLPRDCALVRNSDGSFLECCAGVSSASIRVVSFGRGGLVSAAW